MEENQNDTVESEWDPSPEIKEFLENNFKDKYQLIPKYKKVTNQN